MANQECQVLKHANQWVETIDPSIVTMQALFQTSKEGSANFFKALALMLENLPRNNMRLTKITKETSVIDHDRVVSIQITIQIGSLTHLMTFLRCGISMGVHGISAQNAAEMDVG